MMQKMRDAIKQNKPLRFFLCLGLGIFCTVYPAYGISTVPQGQLVMLPVLVGYTLLFAAALHALQTVVLKYVLPLGALFSLCMVWGWQIENYEMIWFGVDTVCRLLATALLYTALLLLLWRGLAYINGKAQQGTKVAGAKAKTPAWLPWALVWLCMMASWLLLQVALWPGFFQYDAGLQLMWYESGQLYTHHPPLHTFVYGFAVTTLQSLTGSLGWAVGIWLLVQKAFIAACFTYVVYYLHKNGFPKALVVLSAVYYAVSPVIAGFVNCTTKDVLFSALVLLFVLELVNTYRQPGRFASWGHRIRFATVTLAMLLLRNNAAYALLVFLVVMLVVFRGALRRAALPMAAALAVYFIIQGPVFTAMGAIKGDVKEMLCIPLQQLARVYRYAPETFLEEDQALMDAVMPPEEWEGYTPQLADRVKAHANTAPLREDPGAYLSLWVRTGFKTPGIYLAAFLNTNLGYWYPDATLTGYDMAGDGSGRLHNYLPLVGDAELLPTIQIPFIAEKYLNIAVHSSYQNVPVLSLLFSMGTMFFWVCVCFAWALYKKSRAALPMLLFFLAMECTVLLGPIALVRYVLYQYFCAPLLAAMLVRPDFFNTSAAA